MSVNIAKLIEDMGQFAANTKDDKLSVVVARTANKLSHSGASFERDLTELDKKVMRPFIRRQIKEAA